MPQIVSYCVTVKMRHSEWVLASETLTVTVPDIVTIEEAEAQLHDHMMQEWSKCLQAGAPFDLEKGADGRVAVHPDEIAWLKTQVVDCRPEQ